MKLAVLFSGGKDSTLALFKASKLHEIACLITLDSKNKDSYMFHTPIIKVSSLAKKLSFPFLKQKTLGKKEIELKDLKLAIKKAQKEYNIEGIVTGAVASIYQASRVQKICHDLDLYCFNPLWQLSPIDLLQDLVKNNFKFKIVKVAADGLDSSWINKVIDKKTLPDLLKLSQKFRFNPAFEGGEAETEIVSCPLFKK